MKFFNYETGSRAHKVCSSMFSDNMSFWNIGSPNDFDFETPE